MDIQDDHFALFGLPERFELDGAALDVTYRDVLSRVHPDRFAGSGAAEQRVALQWATRANEAYRVLRDPLQRARYLCTLRGRDPADEHDTAMPPAFLMQQLDWREALDAARADDDPTAVEALRMQLEAARTAAREQFERAIVSTGRKTDGLVDGGVDGSVEGGAGEAANTPPVGLEAAVAAVREWMFIERFAADVASTGNLAPGATP